jgi:hypothetical protein
MVGKGEWALPISESSIEQVLCDGLPLGDLVTSVAELYQSKAISADKLKTLERLWVMFTYTELENIWRSSLNHVTPVSLVEEEEVIQGGQL